MKLARWGEVGAEKMGTVPAPGSAAAYTWSQIASVDGGIIWKTRLAEFGVLWGACGACHWYNCWGASVLVFPLFPTFSSFPYILYETPLFPEISLNITRPRINNLQKKNCEG